MCVLTGMPETVQQTPPFEEVLGDHGLALARSTPRILQINLGKLCNLTCVHCHVNAGPKRKEIMTEATMERILDWLRGRDWIETVDLTGGTPEMIPGFCSFVRSVREMNRRVMDRCNLTILNEPGYEWVADFHVENEVAIVASMPCYSPENVNAQRGDGVFDSSIRALQHLNRLGYGRDPRLVLDLVYNPNGAVLPPDQAELEADYKRELWTHFGIGFNNLYAIANMPIARFSSYLKRNGYYEDYMRLLVENFNPASVPGLMCRDTISVDWQGRVYDCDFNQQMGLEHSGERDALHIWELTREDWLRRPIRTGRHCFGCTAGQGSSCSGSTT